MDRRWNNREYYYTDPLFQLELDLQDIRRALVYLLDEPNDDECYVCNRLRCRCAELSLSSYRTTPNNNGMGFPIRSSTDSISEIDYSYVSSDTRSEFSELDYVDFLPPLANSSFEVDFDDAVESPAEALPTPPPANTLPTPPWECKSHRSTPDTPDPELKAYYDDLLQWVQASHPEITEGGPNMPFPINESINNEINLSWPPHPDSIWNFPQQDYPAAPATMNYYAVYAADFYRLYSGTAHRFNRLFF